jgi:RNA-directed DNA polymerase
MKEPYGEGLAIHSGPESCGGLRKEADEALTGGRVGRVLSPEKPLTTGTPTQSLGAEGNIRSADIARRLLGPAWSKTPGMHGNFSNGNRESLWLAAEDGAAVRVGNPFGRSQR